MPKIIVHNIKISVESDDPHADAIEKCARTLKRAHIDGVRSLKISKESIDARKREDVSFVFSIVVVLSSMPSAAKLASISAVPLKDEPLSMAFGDTPLCHRPVIVGLGPCGMFAALMLAEQGYRPIVIERGQSAEKRQASVRRFYESGVLDPESNIQFGAGGAGTFSDGKLMTRINDPKCSFVLSKFVELGAPEDILTKAKPHIGTDLLLGTVDCAVERIAELGGDVYFGTRLEGIMRTPTGKLCGLKTNIGEIACEVLVLAIGHSARDTYKYLNDDGWDIRQKPFSVGVRIEHLQENINRALYGKYAEKLPPAEYSLSKRMGERGVYSFCMCPGGEVVAAASETGGVVTNGMSRRARDGKNANSAIAVSVLPSDIDGGAMGAIEFCRNIERRAFELGGGDYTAPAQKLSDFFEGRAGDLCGSVAPTYMEHGKVRSCDLHTLLPSFVCSMLESGIRDFGRKIEGFDCPDAILTAPETRTSAPVRITRDSAMVSLSCDGVYPCGEGAGYAGGITSAAVDGVNCALGIMARYRAPSADGC